MKKIIIAFSAILLFVACENRVSKAPESVVSLDRNMEENKKTADKNNVVDKLADFSANDAGKPPQIQKSKQAEPQIPVEKQDWDKRIIKTASVNLEIKDFKTYNSSFRDKVKQVGGYIAQEQQSETEHKIENVLMVKVPVDKFDDAVQLLVKDAEKLNEKKITSEDVTTEFVDTRSRLEAKKQVRIRYLDLLKQAKNMEEILSVQSEINGIQEQIESASGRIEYLTHSSSFSTINLTFYQILNPDKADAAKPSFSAKFSSAFKDGWNWIQELFIVMVSLWPILLAISCVYLAYRRTRKPKIKAA